MSNKVLFVFEGDKTEGQIVDNLQKTFLDAIDKEMSIKCVFGAEIYQIYKDIVADEDLDTFSLLKERSNKNREILKDFTRNDIAEIHMFFDYDGHSTLADDEILSDIINYFNEETGKGKLYVSYPMVESIKHIDDYDNFKYLTVKCKENIKYKNVVHETCLKELAQFSKYDIGTWIKLINAHLMKMNFIVNNNYSFPSAIQSQIQIFSKQLEGYVNITSSVAVLSAFPVFLHDYYGNIRLKEKLTNNQPRKETCS